MKPFQRTITFVDNTCGIDEHAVPVNCRVRRKLRGAFQNFFKGEVTSPDEPGTTFEWLRLFTDFPFPELVIRRMSGYDHDVFRIRQNAQYILEKCREIVGNSDDRVIFGKSGHPNTTLFNSSENHRGSGKILFPVPLNKLGRRCPETYNQVRWIFTVERAKILNEWDFRVRIV